MAKWDFSGYATKNNIKCSDGRTIRQNAFAHNDGQIVPLVWAHLHDDPSNVLGHALLENRNDGVYTYGKFNNTPAGQIAKELVMHGDINYLSIYANHLKQQGGDVLHGQIREVSLVMAGANPGASIDTLSFAHADGSECDEAQITSGEEIELFHSDLVEEEKEDSDMDAKTVGDIIDGLTEEQQTAVYYAIGAAAEGAEIEHADMYGEEEDYYDEGGYEVLKHNVFDAETDVTGNVLSHADMEQIFRDAKRLGSLRDAVDEFCMVNELSHADDQDYGIRNIDYLFPEAKSLNTPPDFIKREMDWVKTVMNGVHHTPFSRIKSMFADITEDEARARGYIKGKYKKEEVFALLKRTTTPQTVYKKQKLDRDDVIDIVDFDVVAWLKQEMRMMLDEELARAILIGDGRLASDDDHISHEHIRPILTDDDLYAVKCPVVEVPDENFAKTTINTIIKSRKKYKGSGSPTFYTTEDVLTEMLLLEDGIGHKLYKTEAEVATALRVSKIVTVPVMENVKDETGKPVIGIIVNLSDYNVGADKGGAVSMFDDFDIDYNQQKYLIETRCSGALIKPFSALVMVEDNEG